MSQNITPPVKKGWILIPCDGEAHKNPHIDNCMSCAPRWGEVEVHEKSFKLGARNAVREMMRNDREAAERLGL